MANRAQRRQAAKKEWERRYASEVDIFKTESGRVKMRPQLPVTGTRKERRKRARELLKQV